MKQALFAIAIVLTVCLASSAVNARNEEAWAEFYGRVEKLSQETMALFQEIDAANHVFEETVSLLRSSTYHPLSIVDALRVEAEHLARLSALMLKADKNRQEWDALLTDIYDLCKKENPDDPC